MIEPIYYLIGVSYGDAYLNCDNKQSHYCFRLTAKDKAFILKFKRCMELLFNRNFKITKVYNKKYDKYYLSVASQRKQEVRHIQMIKATLKLDTLDKTKKVQILKGIFDSEASITFYNRLRIKNGYRYRSPELLIRIAQSKEKGRANKIINGLLKSFKLKFSRNK